MNVTWGRSRPSPVRALTIEDLRRGARRHLPRIIFDYADGGAGDEITVRRNREAFERLAFRPRALVDVSNRDLTVTVLGDRLASPVLVAPTGMAGLCWPRGEVEAARAAGHAGTAYVLSMYASCSIEAVAAAATGPLWLQVHVWRNRDTTRALIERARAVGCRALVLGVDSPLISVRERDVRNGFTIPPSVGVRQALDVARHPAWIWRVLRRRPTMPILSAAAGRDPGASVVTLAAISSRELDPGLTWEAVRWVRGLWPGPLVLKGILSVEDARLAADHGADGLVVSNHGGRQLDGAPASAEVLPEVADAVGGRLEVYLDGGVRRGADVVKALALGARAVFVGRPYLYGLAVAGAAGVGRALAILQQELDHTLGLIGVPRAVEVDRHVLRS